MLYRCFTVLLLVAFHHAPGQKIAISNTATQAQKKGYYNWTVFVQTDPATLNSIDHVEYLLHPTFANPQVNINTRNNNFGYSASGWGEFEIKAKVVFRDRRKAPQYFSYWLQLQSRIVSQAVRSRARVKM